MVAQGAHRGPRLGLDSFPGPPVKPTTSDWPATLLGLPAAGSTDAEEQYAGGDGLARSASTAVARRTVAAKAYRDRLAGLHLQEVWRSLGAGRPWLLVGYRTTHGAVPIASHALGSALRRQRAAALGY